MLYLIRMRLGDYNEDIVLLEGPATNIEELQQQWITESIGPVPSKEGPETNGWHLAFRRLKMSDFVTFLKERGFKPVPYHEVM